MKAIHNQFEKSLSELLTVSKIVKFQNESNSQLYERGYKKYIDCVKDR